MVIRAAPPFTAEGLKLPDKVPSQVDADIEATAYELMAGGMKSAAARLQVQLHKLGGSERFDTDPGSRVRCRLTPIPLPEDAARPTQRISCCQPLAECPKRRPMSVSALPPAPIVVPSPPPRF